MSDYHSTENIPDEAAGVKTRLLNRLGTQAMTSVHTIQKAEIIDEWVKDNMDIFDKAIKEAYEKGRADGA